MELTTILVELNLDSEEDFDKIFKSDEDVASWFTVTQEILSYRKIYDRPELVKNFGKLFSINFAKVQNRVALKFDEFQKLLLHKFAIKAQTEFVAFNRQLLNAKNP